METHRAYLVLGLLLVLGSSVMTRSSRDEIECNSRTPLDRSSFQEGFIFGAATSAYQIEGAESEGGPSIWHQFTRIPGKIKDGSNGDVADDSYHRYKEDIRILKEMGLDAYRFSISWSRILPNGKFSGGVNEEGIKYYNNLIDELLANGIKPFVTLLHFDVPQALEDEYGGFLSSRIVNDFYNYVDLCFGKFGDRVKHWVTLNEPWSFSYGGYAMGFLAPGRCSSWQQLSCTGGDSATEPYLVAHYQLLAHAAAVKLYRSKYERRQMGKIGITLISEWFEPYSSTREDYEAALRGLDFMFGWFMDPLTTGDYPQIMRSLVGSRLPTFSKEQSNLLIESFDFLGLNYYSAVYAANAPNSFTLIPSYITDSRVNQLCERDGVPIGPQEQKMEHKRYTDYSEVCDQFHIELYDPQPVTTGAVLPFVSIVELTSSPWLHVYPSGIRDLLLYIKEKYNDPLIYITENGVSEVNNSTLTLLDALDDKMRMAYHRDHLCFLRQAIEGGVKVGGYFIWSLLDNFEWSDGYSVRFGINYVDYKNGLKRYPKHSALWFTGFLRKHNQNSQPTISDH